MKKIIAILLSVTMLLCMQCFTVAAIEDLVGSVNSGTANDYTEGSSSLTQNPGSGNYNVVFTITGGTAARYAVDVEATNLEYTFSTNLIWDVNKLDYVAADSVTVTAPDAPTFMVHNRSNMPVRITLTDTETAAAASAGIALNFAKASMTLSATQPKAEKPVQETFTGSWTCADWPAAFGILKNSYADDQNSVKIATVTVTVTPATEPVVPVNPSN
jgi:hypothetical protein